MEAAIELLDSQGEHALTFRALAARLETGHGAIQWHIANKAELLQAATDAVVARAIAGAGAGAGVGVAAGGAQPREAIRAAALGVFDAIDAHPWAGAELSREPWQSAVLRIFESFGGPLRGLGVPEPEQFDCATALLNYVLGLAGQYAAAARLITRETDRAAFLSALADRWERLDPARYPFTRRAAAKLREHDDREQFLAGLDLILAGAAAAGENGPVDGRAG